MITLAAKLNGAQWAYVCPTCGTTLVRDAASQLVHPEAQCPFVNAVYNEPIPSLDVVTWINHDLVPKW
jgi:hypothetical protein